MPHVPLPNWAQHPIHPPTRRKLRSDDPRYTHVPLLWANPDRTIDIVRCTDDLLDELTEVAVREPARDDTVGTPIDDEVFSDARHTGTRQLLYAVRNRLGFWTFLPADRLLPIGTMERALYTQRYFLPATLDYDALYNATTDAAHTAALAAEAQHVADLSADGWERYTGYYGHSMLLDTRHPDQ